MEQLSWIWSPVVGHMLADVPTVLAHQGGWDEMLMVVVPVAAFAALLYGANRRASQLGAGKSTDESTPGEAPKRVDTEPRNERGGPI